MGIKNEATLNIMRILFTSCASPGYFCLVDARVQLIVNLRAKTKTSGFWFREALVICEKKLTVHWYSE